MRARVRYIPRTSSPICSLSLDVELAERPDHTFLAAHAAAGRSFDADCGFEALLRVDLRELRRCALRYGRRARATRADQGRMAERRRDPAAASSHLFPRR